MRFICPAVILFLSSLLQANPVLIRETGPLSPEDELKGFTVPDDMKVWLEGKNTRLDQLPPALDRRPVLIPLPV